ncbi:MAG TPA: tetratricopeptide repeat protein [Pyrinomonadaceae bacterium]|nr:tetratricopeptide repeat protein [Pyrinomonadaceae bacterium]
MRYLLFVFLFVLSLNVSAQSPRVSEQFSEGSKNASQEKFSDALKNYQSALGLAENERLDTNYRARLRFNIGVCYFRLKQFDQAVEQFKHALILKSDYATAHDALNVAAARRREVKTGLALNRK